MTNDRLPLSSRNAESIFWRGENCVASFEHVRLTELRHSMIVRDLMKTFPKSCGLKTNLAAATELLWSGGCGALPVVDPAGAVLGILTDRDICVALGTRNRIPAELAAEQAMSTQVATCHPSDEIHAALNSMRTRKVRRLPVIGREGNLEGILCLSDLIMHARHDDGSRPQLSYEDVMNTLKCIYWPQSAATTPPDGRSLGK